MPDSFPAPEICPVCGATVPRGARACRECGADERTGWDEDATRYDGLDLPDNAFDDDSTPRDDPGPDPRRPSRGLSRFWWLVGIVLAVVIVALALTARF